SMGSCVGRQGGEQILNVSSDTTNRGSVAHEMLHALGFGHEHNRVDRDLYITVHFDNIRSEYWPYSDGEYVLGSLPYDYTSILHATAFVDPEIAMDVSKPIITRNDAQLG
ncbi:Peptidase M12A, partial [Trinorchestia longiramus]